MLNSVNLCILNTIMKIFLGTETNITTKQLFLVFALSILFFPLLRVSPSLCTQTHTNICTLTSAHTRPRLVCCRVISYTEAVEGGNEVFSPPPTPVPPSAFVPSAPSSLSPSLYFFLSPFSFAIFSVSLTFEICTSCISRANYLHRHLF